MRVIGRCARRNWRIAKVLSVAYGTIFGKVAVADMCALAPSQSAIHYVICENDGDICRQSAVRSVGFSIRIYLNSWTHNAYIYNVVSLYFLDLCSFFSSLQLIVAYSTNYP